jgi:1-acyl-sn-glycerol-3-phosphate acyltransferase
VKLTWAYALVMAVGTPIVRGWGRLRVVGAEHVPASGPVVLMANHDSAWDPVVVGVAAVRRRQVRALAKDSLWKNKVVGAVLDRMGQIPVSRGRGDAAALAAAVAVLRDGGCIGVFPEGTVSRGRTMKVFSGAGRLAQAVEGTPVVGVRITGAVDVVRFPVRPRITVEFLPPVQPLPGESALALTRRVVAEVRSTAPPQIPGRAKAAAGFRQLVAEHDAQRPTG